MKQNKIPMFSFITFTLSPLSIYTYTIPVKHLHPLTNQSSQWTCGRNRLFRNNGKTKPDSVFSCLLHRFLFTSSSFFQTPPPPLPPPPRTLLPVLPKCDDVKARAWGGAGGVQETQEHVVQSDYGFYNARTHSTNI